mgnify:CR=1 FL=1
MQQKKDHFNPISILILALLFLFSGPVPSVAQTPMVPGSQAEISLTFAPLVKKSAPAVVNIYAARLVERRRSPFFNDPFFEHFFGAPFGGSRSRVENSLGSGVIVSPDGLIVTNAHVAGGATDITVILRDRQEYKAELVLVDEQSDLAMLKIINNQNGRTFPFLPVANSSAVAVGDLVLAIGNPFGVGQTVTSGIVSALARTPVQGQAFGYYIQTDAAINPGNSGGALINNRGALIGINTMIFSQSGASHGVGFATPSNLIPGLVEAAAAGETRIKRPWLGASLQEITVETAEALDLSLPTGVLVSDIYKGGPADEAGIEVGDIILAVNGHNTYEPQGVRYHVATLRAGDRADITILQEDDRSARILPVRYPPEEPPRHESRLEGQHPLSGATVINISPAVIAEMGSDLPEKGVVISDVDPRSAARRLGVQAGDVVLSINGTTVERVEQLKTIISSARSQSWRLRFKRGAQVITTMVNR